jgi:hypothetical protein
MQRELLMREYRVVADYSLFHRIDKDEQTVIYGPFRGFFAFLKAYWIAWRHTLKYPASLATVQFREISS